MAIANNLPAALRHIIYAVNQPRKMRKRWARFDRDRSERLSKYAEDSFPTEARPDVQAELNENGYAVLRGFLPPGTLSAIRDEFEACLNDGTGLRPGARDSARQAGDRDAARDRLTPQEMNRGQAYLRLHTNDVIVREPLLSCPSIMPVAFDERIIDIAHEYLGCFPGLTGLNLRKSYVNDLPGFDTRYFHIDPNSAKFLKFFFYLNDVDEHGGPFCYVRGGPGKRARGWARRFRWTEDEIVRTYGERSIVNVTASIGDLIIADTTGFHRGVKTTSRDRMMLTLNYGVGLEMGSIKSFRIDRGRLSSLSPKQEAAADFLEAVDPPLASDR